MSRVFMVAARRTVISPKGGALAPHSFHALAAQVARAVLADAQIEIAQVEGLLLGNALAAGGNPARLVALALEPSGSMPAWSIDTQCCSGLDAIALAADRIRAGSAHVLLAGGAESASQAPQRASRSAEIDTGWAVYDEADFTPWPDQEPSMVEAARALSDQLGDPHAEHAWAVRSHARARAARHPERLAVGLAEGQHTRDTFTRALTLQACQRAAHHPIHNPTTMAPLADGAAMVLLMSAHALHARGISVCEVLSSCQVGGDPFTPGLSTAALRDWLDQLRVDHGEPDCVELMESFAAQALLNTQALGLEPDRVNMDGGLLAMGHPIGASSAVLAARLHHRLGPEQWGVALIPAAGGLASGLALRGLDPLGARGPEGLEP